MKNKILIINYCLQLAGAEKYVFEICKFAKENNIKPYVLIPNSLKKEYYDDIFKQYDIKVIRVNIMGLKTSLKKLQLKTGKSPDKSGKRRNEGSVPLERGYSSCRSCNTGVHGIQEWQTYDSSYLC